MIKSNRCISLLFFIAIISCRSNKTIQQAGVTASPQVEMTGSCSQTIKYFSDKGIMTKTGKDMEMHTEITINPSASIISISGEVPGEEKAAFEMVIEHFDCSLTARFTAGEAIYAGYIKQQDGTSTKAWLKIEAKDGSLLMSNGDPEEESEFTIVVNKWEVVKS
jgi:hypothetical protein